MTGQRSFLSAACHPGGAGGRTRAELGPSQPGDSGHDGRWPRRNPRTRRKNSRDSARSREARRHRHVRSGAAAARSISVRVLASPVRADGEETPDKNAGPDLRPIRQWARTFPLRAGEAFLGETLREAALRGSGLPQTFRESDPTSASRSRRSAPALPFAGPELAAGKPGGAYPLPNGMRSGRKNAHAVSALANASLLSEARRVLWPSARTLAAAESG